MSVARPGQAGERAQAKSGLQSAMRQPVDLSSLLELRALQRPGKPDAVAQIVNHFLEETTQRLVTLRHAVETDDPQLLERAAHALKGISGTVGANEILD